MSLSSPHHHKGDNRKTDQAIRKYGQTLFSQAFVFGEPSLILSVKIEKKLIEMCAYISESGSEDKRRKFRLILMLSCCQADAGHCHNINIVVILFDYQDSSFS